MRTLGSALGFIYDIEKPAMKNIRDAMKLYKKVRTIRTKKARFAERCKLSVFLGVSVVAVIVAVVLNSEQPDVLS